MAIALAALFLFATLAIALPSRALAAPPYVDRGLTLPRHDWAFNFGAGLAHGYVPVGPSLLGPGFNFDMGVGLTRDIELGFRGGARFGNDARILRADQAGRLFDTETFGTGNDTLSNPELRFRWRFADGRVGEVGLEARAYLPFETGTRMGVMAGLPIALHLGRAVRIDTGVNVPVLFYNPTASLVSIPLRVWFQPSPNLWLGPISALRIRWRDSLFFPAPPGAPDATRADLLLGFGMGFSVANPVDLKLQALFPRITETEGARNFSLGFGVEVRIE